MKKFISCWTIIFVTSYLNVQAQSFSLTAPGNLPVNYGDTITVTGTTATIPFGIVYIKNNAAVMKPVMVLRDELSMVPGTSSAFAFGWNMYYPTVSLSPYSYDLLPGVLDSSFQGWYFPNGLSGTSYIQYTFFDEYNPSDSAWVVFKYGISQATSLIEEKGDEQIKVTPNPVINKFIISPLTDPASIFIYDAIGRFQGLYKTEFPNTEIDISNFSKGVYFIAIDTEKGRLGKLFVN